jgi:hypothetical protein
MTLLLSSWALFGSAQTLPVRAYTFAASTGPYADLSSINGFVLDIQQDNNDSRTLLLGFPFSFEGRTYTEFTVSSEGWLSLGASPANVNSTNDLAALNRPALLAPFWDDLNGDLGVASYATVGTAPNRAFTMEWRHWRWPTNAYVNVVGAPSTTTLSFQVTLFETTGVIQYRYRQEAGVPFPTTNLSATIGLAGVGGFLSLGDASAAPTASASASTNTLVQRPATGQVYTFTPPAPCPVPTGVTATATSATTATVGFTPGAGSPTSYAVTYSRASGNPGTAVVTAPVAPVVLTGLAPNTTYFVFVASTCGNGASSPSTPTPVYFTTPPLPNAAATWTGAVSTAWDVAGNWNPAAVPTLTTDVVLPAVANAPVVTGLQTCGALTLRAGATLTLATAAGAAPATRLSTGGAVLLPGGSAVVQAAGTTLAVGGNLTNNGATLTLAPSSTVAFDQVRPHALTGTAATALQNLTLGSPAMGARLDVSVPLSVQRLLKSTQIGFVQVLAGGSLRLLSNAQGTAQIVSDVGFFVVGPVTVERALAGPAGAYAGPGHRAYAAPLSTGTVAGLATAGFAPVVNAAYNTSPAPASVTPFPTVFGYEQSRISTNVDGLADFERGFYSPDAPADTLRPGLGYRLDAPGAATLALTGELTTDDVVVSGLTRATLPQSGYHLLGNPFASTLDWAAVAAAATGLDAAVYVYQPAGPTAGTYQAYVNGVGAPRYLLPGQAFLVRVSAASRPATVSFASAGRYGDYFDPASPPAAPAETRPLVQLTLASPTGGPADEATVYFQTGATAGFDARFDAHKVPTGGVPYLAFAGSAPLAISGLPVLGPADVVLPLDVRVPATGPYTLTAAPLRNLPPGTYAYLRDAQTGAATDLAQQPAAPFTMNAAFAGPRFSLVLTRTQILAVAPAALRQQVALYPNPAHGSVLLELPAALQRLPVPATVTNALGQVVRSSTLPAAMGAHTLPLTGLAPGVYTVRITTEYGTIAKRLLVE